MLGEEGESGGGTRVPETGGAGKYRDESSRVGRGRSGGGPSGGTVKGPPETGVLPRPRSPLHTHTLRLCPSKVFPPGVQRHHPSPLTPRSSVLHPRRVVRADPVGAREVGEELVLTGEEGERESTAGSTYSTSTLQCTTPLHSLRPQEVSVPSTGVNPEFPQDQCPYVRGSTRVHMCGLVRP